MRLRMGFVRSIDVATTYRARWGMRATNPGSRPLFRAAGEFRANRPAGPDVNETVVKSLRKIGPQKPRDRHRGPRRTLSHAFLWGSSRSAARYGGKSMLWRRRLRRVGKKIAGTPRQHRIS